MANKAPGGGGGVLGGFYDGFNDASLDAFWQTSGVTIAETGGVLQITGTTIAHIRSVSAYNFSSQTIRCSFVAVPAASAAYGQQMIIADGDSFANYYMAQVYNGNLSLIRNGSTRHTVAYNATNHAYIQLRIASGTIYLETSLDNVTFTTLYSEAITIIVTAMYVYLRVINTGTSATHKFDEFDSTAFVTPPGWNAVTWTSLVNVTNSPTGTLTKTGGSNSTWDAGSFSNESFTGNGGIRWTWLTGDAAYMVGFSTSNPNASYASVGWGIVLSGGSWFIYENSVYQAATGGFVNGDQFSIIRTGTTVIYKKNGITIHTSVNSSTGALFADTSFYTSGAIVRGVEYQQG